MCPHCTRRFQSNRELWAHRHDVHKAQEGLPVPEFRGRAGSGPSAPDPRDYVWFGEAPPKIREYELKRMSDPRQVIRRKCDNFGVLDYDKPIPEQIVRSIHTRSTSAEHEAQVEYRNSLFKQRDAQEKQAQQDSEVVESASHDLGVDIQAMIDAAVEKALSEIRKSR